MIERRGCPQRSAHLAAGSGHLLWGKRLLRSGRSRGIQAVQVHDEAADTIPNERFLNWVHSQIMSARQRNEQRLTDFASALDAVAGAVPDDEIRNGIDITRSRIDDRLERMNKATEARPDTMERARQALSRQQQLLKHD